MVPILHHLSTSLTAFRTAKMNDMALPQQKRQLKLIFRFGTPLAIVSLSAATDGQNEKRKSRKNLI